MKSAIILSCIAVTILAATPVSATIWHVPGDAPTIQEGIGLALEADTVLVACGTYYEHDIVMKSGITLMSETGDPDCVTIDAQAQGARGVLYCENMSENTRIEGFTLTNSSGDPAMLCTNSSPALARIRFEHNGWDEFGANGGGLLCQDSSSPHLTDCEFIDNGDLIGGGMKCLDGSPVLERVVFDRNFAAADIEPRGAGMFCYGGTPTFIDVLFSGNEGGRALTLVDCTAAMLTRVTFDRNINGGAEFDGCSPTLTSCTSYGDGFVCINGASPVLEQTIIAFSPYHGIRCVDPASQPVLECCDIFGNAGGDWVDCIEDQYGINGNFSEDPLFCDPANGDLTLDCNSPCLPGNHPDGVDCGLIGALGQGCGATAVEETSWGRIKTLYRR